MNIFFDHFTQSQNNNPPTTVTTSGASSFGLYDTRATTNPYGDDYTIGSGQLEIIGYNSVEGAASYYTNYYYANGNSLDFTHLKSVTFTNCYTTTTGVEAGAFIDVQLLDQNSNNIGLSSSVTLTTSGQSITVNTSGYGMSGVTQVTVEVDIDDNSQTGTLTYNAFVGPFTSIATCVAYGSKISLPWGGFKEIQDLQRGDLIEGGRVARLIRQPLRGRDLVEIIDVAPQALGENQPTERTLFCSEHYLIYRSKRRMAKSLLALPGVKYFKGEAQAILPEEKESSTNRNSPFALYDIQFEDEGSYVVNGLLSQSRSPYAALSPLPEELYFTPEKYREERVPNTLTKEPPLSFDYLLPDGREVESFLKVEKKL